MYHVVNQLITKKINYVNKNTVNDDEAWSFNTIMLIDMQHKSKYSNKTEKIRYLHQYNAQPVSLARQ